MQNVFDAAAELQTTLEQYNWLSAIAVGKVDGQDVIFVYLKKAVRSAIIEELKADGWHGFKVFVEKVGTIHPAIA